MFDVIIPIYRISKPFLTRCLESVFDQSFDDYIVYVCDGTPVEHQDYDAKYLVESYGFVYVRQDPTHPLVSGARNQAVSLGTNPYLAFLDGDDWWYSKYLEEVKEERVVRFFSVNCNGIGPYTLGKLDQIIDASNSRKIDGLFISSSDVRWTKYDKDRMMCNLKM